MLSSSDSAVKVRASISYVDINLIQDDPCGSWDARPTASAEVADRSDETMIK